MSRYERTSPVLLTPEDYQMLCEHRDRLIDGIREALGALGDDTAVYVALTTALRTAGVVQT